MAFGPENGFSKELHATKYRDDNETFDDYCVRYARTAANSENHFRLLLDALRHQRILPAGRQQLAVGRPHTITTMNCFVGGHIDDSMAGIMDELKNGALTLRTGGGIGFDFSSIRPYGEPIRGLGFKAYATGPITFMEMWNAMSGTVMSAGHRRGAMMGTLRCDHPDILKFINAKKDQDSLKNFNLSVLITDDFMKALEADESYELKFDDRVYGELKASEVWAVIMQTNWQYAEPGVLFIDTIGYMNPLYYHTESWPVSTNPCGEVPLPHNGSCLLASLNIVKYLVPKLKTSNGNVFERTYEIDEHLLANDTVATVRALDTIIDKSYYPLDKYKERHQQDRRMGIGVTGVANALEIMGYSYGTPDYIEQQSKLLETIRNVAYTTSAILAKERGPFPLYDEKSYCAGGFFKTLPENIQKLIRENGLRNALLLSIAPTGTISLCADNVSSGIEPPYSLTAKRLVHMNDGQREVEVNDYAYERYGVAGKTAYEVTAEEHVDVLCAAQKYIDHAVSKTCNVYGQIAGQGSGVTYDEFEQLYLRAYKNGAKGCCTFNVNGTKIGIFTTEQQQEENNGACRIDATTGVRTCDT